MVLKQRADQEVLATAILKRGASAPDPGQKATAKLEQDLAAAKYRRGAIQLALEQAEAALVSAVEKERAGILRELDKRSDKAERVYGERAEALLTSRRERDELQRLRTQVDRFPQPTKNSTIERPFPLMKVNGGPTPHAEFAAALRKDASSPALTDATPLVADQPRKVDPLVAA